MNKALEGISDKNLRLQLVALQNRDFSVNSTGICGIDCHYFAKSESGICSKCPFVWFTGLGCASSKQKIEVDDHYLPTGETVLEWIDLIVEELAERRMR